MSPTQRSLKLLRDEGYTVEIVEKWNPHIRRRRDLFGFADLLAIKANAKPVLIQTTSGTNFAARVTKMRALPEFITCLAAGFEIQVHGWRKLVSNRNRWTPKILTVGADECPPQPSDT